LLFFLVSSWRKRKRKRRDVLVWKLEKISCLNTSRWLVVVEGTGLSFDISSNPKDLPLYKNGLLKAEMYIMDLQHFP